MNWEKRDCSIKMELVPYGDGWEDITLAICGDHHWWSVSGCLGDGFWALVESLYALYPHQAHDELEQRRLTEFDEFIGDFQKGEFVNMRPKPEGYTGSYISLPKTAEFFWDHEGWGVRWKLTKESGQERDFLLTIDLEETEGDQSDDDHKTFHYTVRYSELCYAVGKAITEALKKHGFGGFHTSVWESDVNVRHLCFLKACGMGNPDAVHPFDSAEKGVGAVSSFADEIELLLFDM
jgi:hypothetical protein